MRLDADPEYKKGLIGPFQVLVEPAAQRLDGVFAECFQAAGTELHRDKLATHKDFGLLNVGLELASGMPLRKADIVPKLGFLSTSFAYCHGDITFFCNAISLTMEPENTSGSRF